MLRKNKQRSAFFIRVSGHLPTSQHMHGAFEHPEQKACPSLSRGGLTGAIRRGYRSGVTGRNLAESRERRRCREGVRPVLGSVPVRMRRHVLRHAHGHMSRRAYVPHCRPGFMDMCVDMFMDMCIDLWQKYGRHASRSVHRHRCNHVYRRVLWCPVIRGSARWKCSQCTGRFPRRFYASIFFFFGSVRSTEEHN